MNTFQVTRGAKVTAYVPGTGFIDGTVTGKGNSNGFWFITDAQGRRHETHRRSISPAQVERERPEFPMYVGSDGQEHGEF